MVRGYGIIWNIVDGADWKHLDPLQWIDTDGDGVGDVADFYPSDSKRSVEEGGIAMPFWIALVIVVFVGIAGVAVFIMRRSGNDGEEEYAGAFSVDPQPAQNIYDMAGIGEQSPEVPPTSQTVAPAHATINEHGQKSWVDESGISWCQEPDGSLRRYDAESGAWVSHQ